MDKLLQFLFLNWLKKDTINSQINPTKNAYENVNHLAISKIKFLVKAYIS